MVSFQLSAAQQGLVQFARTFAADNFPAARAAIDKEATPHARFLATKPCYEAGVKAGLVAGCVPPSLGGEAGTMVDFALLAEEFFAVEPTVALNCIANGLGLGPIMAGGTPEQQQKFLAPFLTKTGAPLASLSFTEVGGGSGWLSDSGRGMQTTFTRDGDDYIINGEKVWPTSCAGWDFKGADIQCVVGRTSLDSPAAETVAVLVVTRGDIDNNSPGAFEVIHDFATVGMVATSGPHVKFHDLRVPATNMIGTPGSVAIDLVEFSFTQSAALVAAMSVGIMRHAFELALDFARIDTRNGPHPVIGHQSVADLLIEIKAKLEASRYLTWKACTELDGNGSREHAYLAKIYCSEAAMEVVVASARVIGTMSFDKSRYPFDTLLQDALCMSIFDGGNVAVRRRQLQALYSAPNYDPDPFVQVGL